MTDDDLDLLLTTHGEQWRGANSERPGISWDAVTTPNRGRAWLAVAGVVIAAAAVIVPVVVTVSHGARPQHPPPVGSAPSSPLPRDPLDYQRGAPPQYFGLAHGNIHQVGEVVGQTFERPPVVAVGGLGIGSAVYVASALPNCRTALAERVFALSGDGSQLRDEPRTLATVAGEPAGVPIAVSERAGMLALVVTQAFHGHYSGNVLPCTGPQQLVFVDLSGGGVTNVVPVQNAGLQIDSLAFSPDGSELAYRLGPNVDRVGPLSRTTLDAVGTHVMSVHETLRDLEAYPRVLGAAAPDGASYGPVLWWRDELAVFVDGDLRRLDGNGGLGQVVATGFTGKVDTASVDASGNHMLIGAAGRSFRWDYGELTKLPGHLLQPTW
jgi:hypothetical protein